MRVSSLCGTPLSAASGWLIPRSRVWSPRKRTLGPYLAAIHRIPIAHVSVQAAHAGCSRGLGFVDRGWGLGFGLQRTLSKALMTSASPCLVCPSCAAGAAPAEALEYQITPAAAGLVSCVALQAGFVQPRPGDELARFGAALWSNLCVDLPVSGVEVRAVKQ
jgi:hypothetical protein